MGGGVDADSPKRRTKKERKMTEKGKKERREKEKRKEENKEGTWNMRLFFVNYGTYPENCGVYFGLSLFVSPEPKCSEETMQPLCLYVVSVCMYVYVCVACMCVVIWLKFCHNSSTYWCMPTKFTPHVVPTLRTAVRGCEGVGWRSHGVKGHLRSNFKNAQKVDLRSSKVISRSRP